MLVSVGALALHLACSKKVKAAEASGGKTPPPRGHRFVLPVTFTLYSALLGGAQMIVHSKVFAELLSMAFQGDVAVFTGWLLWVELALIVGCGILWVYKLTVCLGMYDPLLILPLMVGTYILFGGVAGGVFFEEFGTLHEGAGGYGRWVLYAFGMISVLVGLYIIADAAARIETSHVAAKPEETETAVTEVVEATGIAEESPRTPKTPSALKLMSPLSVQLPSEAADDVAAATCVDDGIPSGVPSKASTGTSGELSVSRKQLLRAQTGLGSAGVLPSPMAMLMAARRDNVSARRLDSAGSSLGSSKGSSNPGMRSRTLGRRNWCRTVEEDGTVVSTLEEGGATPRGGGGGAATATAATAAGVGARAARGGPGSKRSGLGTIMLESPKKLARQTTAAARATIAARRMARNRAVNGAYGVGGAAAAGSARSLQRGASQSGTTTGSGRVRGQAAAGAPAASELPPSNVTKF